MFLRASDKNKKQIGQTTKGDLERQYLVMEKIVTALEADVSALEQKPLDLPKPVIDDFRGKFLKARAEAEAAA